MPKVAKALGPLEVKRLTAPGFYPVGTVPGLHLLVSPAGSRSWILRVLVAGKRREVGLGGYPAVTLANAHEIARAKRGDVKAGTDPILQRKADRSALMAKQAATKTFKQCAIAYIDAHSAGWRNSKHTAQWTSTLETYAYKKLGELHVQDVATQHVVDVLTPIWTTKTETAVRLKGRIENIIDWAIAHEYRQGPNPARWRGHLDKLLAKPGKVAKKENFPALPIDEAGAFMVKLRALEGGGPRALEFAILTAARSGEVRGAEWSEMDLEQAVWTVPADRMKAGKEHRVPLSPAAVSLLKKQPRMEGTDLVFPSRTLGKLSDMTLTAVLRRMKVEAVPHGFRSTFRDWASERTSYPRDVAEMALAHAIGDKVEAAYRRGDLFDKRLKMMRDWANFLAKPQPAKLQLAAAA